MDRSDRPLGPRFFRIESVILDNDPVRNHQATACQFSSLFERSEELDASFPASFVLSDFYGLCSYAPHSLNMRRSIFKLTPVFSNFRHEKSLSGSKLEPERL